MVVSENVQNSMGDEKRHFVVKSTRMFGSLALRHGAGFVRTPFAGNRIPSSMFDPVAVKVMPVRSKLEKLAEDQFRK